MKKSKKHIVVFASFVLMIFMMFACDSSRVYEDWQDMDNVTWNADSTCCFSFEIEDTVALYRINFGIRHTNLYPYQNIWLFTSLNGVDSFSYQDTIQYNLANKGGVWYGNRSASIYSYIVSLYRNIRFSSPGEYTFTIKHGMRNEELNGVNAIGFRIEKEGS